jgi:D-alanyl-D-alanine carboxypeptidase/D-alanyl-D-alanine-endopeptidase (penicillin-binding protein 4)
MRIIGNKILPLKSVRTILIALFFLLFYSESYSTPPSGDSLKSSYERGYNSIQSLRKDIDQIIDNPDFAGSFIGVSVISLESGEFLYNRNENRNFVPASTLKLVTTAAALDYLGPNFQLTISLYLDGKISENGEFIGNIFIRGQGDPSLCSYFYDNPLEILDRWSEKLDSLGIHSIQGNIIGDDSYFDDVPFGPGWAWDDIAYPFSAPVSSLVINDDKVDITVSQGKKVGDKAIIHTVPNNSYLWVVNNVKTVNKTDETIIVPTRDMKSNIVQLDGNIGYDSTNHNETTISVAVDNPSLFFLNLFKQALERRKIMFHGTLLNISEYGHKIKYSDMEPVCSHVSPPLKEIVAMVNKMSHNLGAEILLKTLAKETVGIGSTTKGVEQIKKYTSKLGIPSDNISIVDGSGLSRFNLISPKYMLTLLSSMYRSDYKEVFINSLAMPGKTGTLKRRMLMSLAETNVCGKSGSMNGVSALCGYINTRDGEMLAFAIYNNNFTVPPTLARNLEDMICMRLASFTRK